MTTIAYNRMREAFFQRTGAVTINLSKISRNIFSRRSRLEKELSHVHAGDKVIIEFGGDDCRFNWKKIARNVNGIHMPKTSVEKFHSSYTKVIEAVRAKGATPILLGLAPIDSEKYFSYIAHGQGREKIISWLGGNYLYLANIHQQYVDEVENIANETGCKYIDITGIFRTNADFDRNLENDGISLSQTGYLRVQTLIQESSEI